MRDLTFWACVRFSLQLMFCGGLLTFHLPRKKNFRFRLFLGGAGYFVIVFLIFHGLRLAFWNLLLGEILYYVLMFLTGLFLVRLCFQVSEKELVFIGTGAYAMQHMTFNLTQIFTYIPVLGERLGESMLWNSVFPYLAVPALVYYFLIRKFREQGELKEKDTRMLLLSLVTIFITIVVSLGARMAGGSPLQELIYYIYGFLCCCLALFILMYIPKENRLYHEQQTLEQIIQVMGEQQQTAKESVEIINRKCHDIKHQLKALMEVEDREQRKKYTEEIRQAVSIYDAVYHTGNTALDFVLREKALRCQEYEIKFSCLTDGEALESMDTLDILIPIPQKTEMR